MVWPSCPRWPRTCLRREATKVRAGSRASKRWAEMGEWVRRVALRTVTTYRSRNPRSIIPRLARARPASVRDDDEADDRAERDDTKDDRNRAIDSVVARGRLACFGVLQLIASSGAVEIRCKGRDMLGNPIQGAHADSCCDAIFVDGLFHAQSTRSSFWAHLGLTTPRTHSWGTRSSRSSSKLSFGTGTVSSVRTELIKVNFVAASRPDSPIRPRLRQDDWRQGIASDKELMDRAIGKLVGTGGSAVSSTSGGGKGALVLGIGLRVEC